MKKVIDVNYLQKPELEDYLAKSRDNYVVLTDFACMEIYKSNALENLACKIEIISRYSKQVIMLKRVQDIVSITLGSSNLPESLIDNMQTTGFSQFCDLTKRDCQGDKLLSREVLLKEFLASQYLSNLTKYHQYKIAGIKDIAESYDPAQLKVVRSGKDLTPEIWEKITDGILSLTEDLFIGHPDVKTLPEISSLRNSYIFRYAICVYFLALRWIKMGGIEQVSPEKLRNDSVDMNYVAYATYFDGLLSMDKKLNDIFIDTLDYLNRLDRPYPYSL